MWLNWWADWVNLCQIGKDISWARTGAYLSELKMNSHFYQCTICLFYIQFDCFFVYESYFRLVKEQQYDLMMIQKRPKSHLRKSNKEVLLYLLQHISSQPVTINSNLKETEGILDCGYDIFSALKSKATFLILYCQYIEIFLKIAWWEEFHYVWMGV